MYGFVRLALERHEKYMKGGGVLYVYNRVFLVALGSHSLGCILVLAIVACHE